MSEPLLTKRLHISGITPSITPADLEHRLSSFGRVMAMDGFGARDALGDPRKFGFVTMEISAKGLAKCLNVLSGSTWKGAKLRVSEAKPDFRERLAQINAQPPKPARPTRMRVQNYGRPSSTLPLTPLSATAAASTPGWIVTPSGRVVRPMRMRPGRPLELMHSESSTSKSRSINGKIKKRIKPPPLRARRRLIDPTKWDSVYLKGVFLDTFSVSLPTSMDAPRLSDLAQPGVVGGEEEEEEGNTDSGASSAIVWKEVEPVHHVPRLALDHVRSMSSAVHLQEATLTTSSRIHEATEPVDIRNEANAALTVLGQMFGDKGDWDGKESVDGMEDLEHNEARQEEMHVDEKDEIEIMPHDSVEWNKVAKKRKGKDKEKLPKRVHFNHVDAMDQDVVPVTDVEMDDSPVTVEVSKQTVGPTPQTTLKALFAPREEASFSLLDHLDLDLDLELDADILGISASSGALQDVASPIKSIPSQPHVAQIPTTISTTKACSRVTLDASLPLLFPPPDSLPHRHNTPSSNPTTTTYRHNTPTCFLFPSATRLRDIYHLPPSVTFTRSPQDTPESIRERWEKDKSALTHEWKRAWREARGSRKGKMGAEGDVGY